MTESPTVLELTEEIILEVLEESDTTKVESFDITIDSKYKYNLKNMMGLSTFQNIKKLNLSYNMISDLIGIEKLIKLESLNLSENCIKDMAPLSTLSQLHSLNLNTNIIEKIPEVEYCYIIQIVFQLSQLGDLKMLRILKLARNKLMTEKDISNLIFFENLELLTLAGNPIAESTDYKGIVECLVDNLTQLDSKVITLDQNDSIPNQSPKNKSISSSQQDYSEEEVKEDIKSIEKYIGGHKRQQSKSEKVEYRRSENNLPIVENLDIGDDIDQENIARSNPTPPKTDPNVEDAKNPETRSLILDNDHRIPQNSLMSATWNQGTQENIENYVKDLNKNNYESIVEEVEPRNLGFDHAVQNLASNFNQLNYENLVVNILNFCKKEIINKPPPPQHRLPKTYSKTVNEVNKELLFEKEEKRNRFSNIETINELIESEDFENATINEASQIRPPLPHGGSLYSGQDQNYPKDFQVNQQKNVIKRKEGERGKGELEGFEQSKLVDQRIASEDIYQRTVKIEMIGKTLQEFEDSNKMYKNLGKLKKEISKILRCFRINQFELFDFSVYSQLRLQFEDLLISRDHLQKQMEYYEEQNDSMEKQLQILGKQIKRNVIHRTTQTLPLKTAPKQQLFEEENVIVDRGQHDDFITFSIPQKQRQHINSEESSKKSSRHSAGPTEDIIDELSLENLNKEFIDLLSSKKSLERDISIINKDIIESKLEAEQSITYKAQIKKKIKSLKQESDRLEKKLMIQEQVYEELLEQTNSLEGKRIESSKLMKEIENLKSESKDLEKSVIELETQQKELAKNNKTCKKEYENCKFESENYSKKVKKSKKEYSSLKSLVEDLSSQKEYLKKLIEDVSENEDKLKSTEMEVDLLTKKYASKEKILKEIEERTENMEAKQKEFRKTKFQFQEMVNDLEVKKEELGAQIKMLSIEKQDKEDEVVELHIKADGLKAVIQESQNIQKELEDSIKIWKEDGKKFENEYLKLSEKRNLLTPIVDKLVINYEQFTDRQKTLKKMQDETILYLALSGNKLDRKSKKRVQKMVEVYHEVEGNLLQSGNHKNNRGQSYY